ncbi:universal stress protein [Telluribacter humicola]|uniref:universal stress protein n=1 Tax=Telluribacter humicola TaxID=1720261 RepID=UPI001A973C52|nr:universal stress protein [Telluribacter humicola]
MKALKTILVPTDFSSAALNGIRYAVQLATLLDASIILYHTYSPIKSSFSPEATQDEENRELERTLFNSLNSIRDEIVQNGSRVPVSICLDRGHERNQITKYCSGNAVDLIIMGTTGATGAKEVLIGSFTSHVISTAACPVLAIPPAFEFKAPKTLLYASDYKSTDFPGIQYTIKLKDQLQAELIMVHVVYSLLFAAQEDELFEAYQAKLAKLLHLNVAELPYHLVQGEDTAGTLLQYAVKEGADMLVISQSKHTNLWDWLFHRSITKAVVHHALVPILAFPTDFLDLLPVPEHTTELDKTVAGL